MNAMAPIVAAPVEQLPLGIHFNVPDDVYFAQDALGSTDKKELAIDPVEWQFKRLHGENKDTKAKIWGSGLHCRVLEGRAAFAERFRALPAKTSIEGLLITRDDYTDFLKRAAVYFKSSDTKPVLAKLIREVDADAPIWDDIVAEFERDVPERNRVSTDMVDEINLAAEWMQADPMIAPIMEDGTFQFGSPELTVIYELDGVRCRARFDYMIPGRILDLKRYSPWRNGDPLVGITQAIGNFRYDLQAADYLKAFDQGVKLYRAGKVFGAEPYDHYLDKTFGTAKRPKWVWVFVKGEGAPQPRVVELPHNLTVFKVAETQVDLAVERYRQNVETYGLDRDWRPETGAIHLADEDFPAWFGRN